MRKVLNNKLAKVTVASAIASSIVVPAVVVNAAESEGSETLNLSISDESSLVKTDKGYVLTVKAEGENIKTLEMGHDFDENGKYTFEKLKGERCLSIKLSYLFNV